MEAVAELQRLVGLTNNSEVKKVLTQQINKMTTEIAATIEIQVPEKVNPESTPKKAAPAPLKPKARWAKINQYSWDQSDKLLKFYLRGIKNVESAENVKIEIERCNMKVIVTDGSGKDHVLDLKELSGDISGSVKPTIKVKSDYVYVSVTKDYPKSKWDALTLSDVEKAKRKEAEKKSASDSMGSGGDPQKGMMDMMKKMYDEGDDSMKQMMNKAYETKGKDGGAGGMGGMADMMGGMGGMAGGPPSGGMGMGGAGKKDPMPGMADMLKNMGGAGGVGGADPAGGPPGGMDMAAMMKMLGGAGGAGGADGADGAKDPMAGMADMLKMMGGAGGAGGAGGPGGMDMAEMMKNMGGAGGMADMLKNMGGADEKNADLGVEEIE